MSSQTAKTLFSTLIHPGWTAPDNRPAVRFPIRAKIVIPYFLLSLFLAVGSLFLAFKVINFNIDERFNSQLEGTGKLAIEWMPRETDRMIETLRLLAYSEGAGLAIQTRDAERLRELTFGIVVDHLEEAVEFLDPNGNLVLSMRHRKGGKIEEYEYGSGGEAVFKDWGIVKEILENKTDRIGNKYSGFVRAPWGDYLYISGPVYQSNGEFVGVVLIGQRVQSLVQKMHESTLAQISLYDLKGQVIASTFFDPIPIDPGQILELRANQETSSRSRRINDMQAADQKRELSVANINYTEILGSWETRHYEDIGVIGVSMFKPVEIHTSVWDKLLVISLLVLAFILLVLIGLTLSNHITRPLLRLVNASLEVSHGDLNIHVQPETNDEIAILSEHFNQMVNGLKQSRDDLIDAWDTTIAGWAKALGVRDNETGQHCERVTAWAVYIAKQMGIPQEMLIHVRRGALLHDVGKIGVPDQILLKPGRLTEEEMNIMKEHTTHAKQILGKIKHLSQAVDIPYYHHEKWDGSGYPCGLAGEEIPLPARIFSIVDVWDALTNDRPYRKAMEEDEAIAIIKKGRGTHFDPVVLDTFLAHLPELKDLEL